MEEMDGGECFFFFFSWKDYIIVSISGMYSIAINKSIFFFPPIFFMECLLILGAKIESPIYKWTESNNPKGAIKTILPLMGNSYPPITLIN